MTDVERTFDSVDKEPDDKLYGYDTGDLEFSKAVEALEERLTNGAKGVEWMRDALLAGDAIVTAPVEFEYLDLPPHSDLATFLRNVAEGDGGNS